MQKFNYHSHTYRCGHADSEMKDEDYIKEYIEMGFEKIAFTDHCPEKLKIDKRPNIRMDYSQKDEYINSIKRLREKYADKIKIEIGYEVEYLPNDEENLIRRKEECDKIILGQHFVYDNHEELKFFGKDDFTEEELIRYAKYMEKAMQLNLPDIIAHPDMYMVKRKQFKELESEIANRICEAAEKYKIPLEINLNNIFHNTYFEHGVLNKESLEKQKEKLQRVMYPCKKFWDIATKYKLEVVYGIDTHYKGQIMLFHELTELANEIIGKETIRQLHFIEK